MFQNLNIFTFEIRKEWDWEGEGIGSKGGGVTCVTGVKREVKFIYQKYCFFKVIPDETPLDSFQVPVDSVERAAGLLFFDRSTFYSK